MNRRNFIGKISVATTLGVSLVSQKCVETTIEPFFIATWNNERAVKTAYKAYMKSNSLLDGIEKGINFVENDPNDQSVGLGGRPDRSGNVTLDACIMDEEGNAGSVCCISDIQNPISVARAIMEKTPHVILAGEGAKKFALENGHKTAKLLTQQAEKEYKEWLKESKYKPIINIENHDTIGMLGMNADKVVGGCSTSGLGYKMEGRVGDSPIIGAGLFVDNEIGACVATGLGEKVLTTLSAFLVVELIRNGNTPEQACKLALQRILDKEGKKPDFQVALIAIDKKGEKGAYSIYNNFHYVVATKDDFQRTEAKYFYKYE